MNSPPESYKKHLNKNNNYQQTPPQQDVKTDNDRVKERAAGKYADHTANTSAADRNPDLKTDSTGKAAAEKSGGGLNQIQQQFVLKFCRQLVSVIEACEQSESAEIEIGRRQVGSNQVKVKLQAEREYSRGIVKSD